MNVLYDITATSKKLFNKIDPRLEMLYFFLIEICEKGNKDYYKLKTKYHNIDHFLSSARVFLDIYVGSVNKKIIEKNYNDYFCGVVATLFHDIGFIKDKSEKLGTGAQYINCHVDRGCSFIHKNLSEYLTEEESEMICKLIKVTDYFKPNYKVNHNHLGACVALADWLSQLSDERYVDKLEFLYKEFEEYQEYNKINLYVSLEDMVGKTPNFWNKLVKPMLNIHYYNLHETASFDYLGKIEYNIDALVKKYNLVASNKKEKV